MNCVVMAVSRLLWCMAGCCVCLLFSSCQTQGEFEHLEHVTPEHKPASYAEAVTQLSRRVATVLGDNFDKNSQRQELAELGDIIRWLPENAADSDLNKADWEQVNHISNQLATWHKSLSLEQSASQKNRQQIEADLQILSQLVSSSSRFPPLTK